MFLVRSSDVIELFEHTSFVSFVLFVTSSSVSFVAQTSSSCKLVFFETSIEVNSELYPQSSEVKAVFFDTFMLVNWFSLQDTDVNAVLVVRSRNVSWFLPHFNSVSDVTEVKFKDDKLQYQQSIDFNATHPVTLKLIRSWFWLQSRVVSFVFFDKSSDCKLLLEQPRFFSSVKYSIPFRFSIPLLSISNSEI